MRTTVNVDADDYSFIAVYADAKGITLSAALNELVRRAEPATELDSNLVRLKTSPQGYLVIAESGNILKPKMVNGASEDELI